MEKLLEEIKEEALRTSYFTGIKDLSKEVAEAFMSVDRSLFVLPQDKTLAYDDCPLSIGHGQTISQPFIVALMTEALAVKASDKVLDIGTGSGYQLAILAKLAQQVYGIELVPELCALAISNLKKAKITNVEVINGDGTEGLKAHAPFDRILVAAAAKEVPPKLLQQLKIGGIMVIPQSLSTYDQMLLRITKTDQHSLQITKLLPVRFVPLINS